MHMLMLMSTTFPSSLTISLSFPRAVVRTAKPGNLKDSTWARNGVGRLVSHSFGYGLMDAHAMVKQARTWKTVPEQNRCEITSPHFDKYVDDYPTLLGLFLMIWS